MTLQILVHGKPLDPQKAARGDFLPGDIFYVCSYCGSRHVLALPARTIDDLSKETGLAIVSEWNVRQQDRWCQDCDSRWTAILAPEILAR